MTVMRSLLSDMSLLGLEGSAKATERRETLMETVKDGDRQNGFIFFNQEME